MANGLTAANRVDVPTAQLGSTPLQVSRVGFGAWAVGGGDWQGGWGPQDDDESVAAIHHAIDLGINWIDTAPAYGLGHAEEVVGRALQQLPEADRPYLFTKCGLVWTEGARSVTNVLAPESIRGECEASLRRLGLERLDLLQIHWPTDDGTPLEESWATLAALVEEGKVGYIGVSNFGTDLLETCEAVRHVDTNQPELNLVTRRAAADIVPWCAAHGTGVLAYSPMRSGLLTGRFSAERVRSLPDDDWRASDADFAEPRLSRNLALVDRLRAIADRLGCSLPELAVAWTLAWPGVSAAIVGARRPDQVDGWVGAAAVSLSDDDLDDIAGAVRETGAGEGPNRPSRP
ncbi:MAG TPA: aldo/keto reductase [Acidimicrobiales bacterium]|jgi:aryl-alcohol dehydrogenase-like predicted oxidoreductase|nr:aldo/keto reductase [Acidimicrobiales bacterium]